MLGHPVVHQLAVGDVDLERPCVIPRQAPVDEHRAEHPVAFEVGEHLGGLEARVRLLGGAHRFPHQPVALELRGRRLHHGTHRHRPGPRVHQVVAVVAALQPGEPLAVRLGQFVEHRERRRDVAIGRDHLPHGVSPSCTTRSGASASCVQLRCSGTSMKASGDRRTGAASACAGARVARQPPNAHVEHGQDLFRTDHAVGVVRHRPADDKAKHREDLVDVHRICIVVGTTRRTALRPPAHPAR